MDTELETLQKILEVLENIYTDVELIGAVVLLLLCILFLKWLFD